MQERQLINEDMHLYLCTDQNGNKNYVVEGPLSPGQKYELEGIDCPIMLPSIGPNIELTFSTSSHILIKGHFAGKLTVTNHSNFKYNLMVQGDILPSAIVRTIGENAFKVQGNVAGQLYTRCVTVIEKDIQATAKVDVEKLKVLGRIIQKSEVKSRQEIEFNKILNPQFELTERGAAQSPVVSKVTIPPSTQQSPKPLPKTIVSHTPFRSPFSKKNDSLAQRKSDKIIANNEQLKAEAIPLGRKNSTGYTLKKMEAMPALQKTRNQKVSSSPDSKRKVDQIGSPGAKKIKMNEKLESNSTSQLGKLGTPQSYKQPIKTKASDELEDFVSELDEILMKPEAAPTVLKQEDFADLEQEILYELENESFSDIDDDELDEYIKEDHEVASDHAAANFEMKRNGIVAKIANFNEEIIKTNGQMPLDSQAKPIKLQNHQIDGLQALQAFAEQDKTSGYVKMPTGSGKTIEMQAYWLAMGMPRLLIVVSRSELIHQTVKDFESHFPGCDIGIYDGTHKRFGRNVTVTTYQSLQSQYHKLANERDIKPGEFLAVFCDEAHNALGEGRHEPVQEFFKSAFVIGFSATDEYNNSLKGGLHSLQQLFGHLIFKYTLPQAIEDKVLVPCQVIKVDVHAKINIGAIRKTASKGMEGEGDYSERELAKQLDQEKIRNLFPFIYGNGFCNRTNERLLGKSTLVFGLTIDDCKKIKNAFEKALSNHPFYRNQPNIQIAEVISGELSHGRRKEILDKYNAGKLTVLINAMLCTEGIDLPRTEIVMLGAPSTSWVKVPQQAGRVTRKWWEKLNKIGTIIHFMYPGLEQLTFDHFLGSTICGEKYIVPSASADEQMPLLNMLNVEQFEVRDNQFQVLTNAPTLEQVSSAMRSLEKNSSQGTLLNTNMGMFSRAQKTPVPIFKNPGARPAVHNTHMEKTEFTHNPQW